MNILMPMAGEGIRLQGFADLPKPLVQVGDYPIFMWALHSAPLTNNFIFIVKDEHIRLNSIHSVIKKAFPESTVIAQEGKVDGAAITTLLVQDLIDNDEPLLIVDCDVFTNIDYSVFNFIDSDGAIVVANSTAPTCAYVNIEDNFITEVAEKNQISDIAVAGIYFWQKGSDYVKYAKKMIKNNIKVNGEFYISPTYNEAIKDNKKIIAIPTETFYHLGCEEEIKKFTER